MAMDPDSAFGMFDAMGSDVAMTLEGDQLSGMFGAMEHDKMGEYAWRCGF
ncbi:MAG: hypothetical protein CM1200mP22_16300 [Dehalococcoidia bacterium]|nr:MAG: hypothetical protein CM1200mP22_16300 [Dehalococcoidia bacterium]